MENELLTRRQKEEYVIGNLEPRPGESLEDFNLRSEERTTNLKQDLDREENKGTLRLMDVTEHRDRAAELLEMADNEPHQEKALILIEAAQVHFRHARRLEAEAAENEEDAV